MTLKKEYWSIQSKYGCTEEAWTESTRKHRFEHAQINWWIIEKRWTSKKNCKEILNLVTSSFRVY